MLHIVNGDSMEQKLKQGVIKEEILVWREIFTEGAVFEELTEEHNLQERASSLEKCMGIPASIYIDGVYKQEERLAQALNSQEEIILWFEHDLFDQTILWYLLYRLQQLNVSDHQIYLLSIGAYPGIEPFLGMGQLNLEQLQTIAGTWKPVTKQQLELGKIAWQAYTSPSPTALEQLLNQDTSALPYLHQAVHMHLNRFPSVNNGLNVVEQMTLEKLMAAAAKPLDLFRQVNRKLADFGMGDLQFWSALEAMMAAPSPLISLQPDDPRTNALLELPKFNHTDPAFLDANIMITESGKEVCQGAEDWLKKCQFDRWLGGVHLHGSKEIWRWDAEMKTLVKE